MTDPWNENYPTRAVVKIDQNSPSTYTQGMNDPAEKIEVIDAIAVDGLDDLFTANATASQQNAVETQQNATAPQSNAVERNCTVKEASELLEVPTSTIYRRIKAGKYEITGHSESGAKLIKVQLHTQQDATALQQDAAAPQLNAVGTQQDATAPLPDPAIQLVGELTKRLEAAAVRIGYLESENQRYREETKLIPDLQGQATRAAQLEKELERLKAPWWRRFWRWFIGQ